MAKLLVWAERYEIREMMVRKTAPSTRILSDGLKEPSPAEIFAALPAAFRVQRREF